MIRRLLDRLRWRTLHGDLDYAAAGDLAWLLLSRRGRRTVKIPQDRDTLVDLAHCIVDGERRQQELCEGSDLQPLGTMIWTVPGGEAVVDRVVDAARRVAGLEHLGDHQTWREVAGAHRRLCEALDALDSAMAKSATISRGSAIDEDLPDWERELLERQEAQWVDAAPESNAAATDHPRPDRPRAPEAGEDRSGVRWWDRDDVNQTIAALGLAGERGLAGQIEALLAERDELTAAEGGIAEGGITAALADLEQVPHDDCVRIHDDECWREHADCLATRTRRTLTGEDTP